MARTPVFNCAPTVVLLLLVAVCSSQHITSFANNYYNFSNPDPMNNYYSTSNYMTHYYPQYEFQTASEVGKYEANTQSPLQQGQSLDSSFLNGIHGSGVLQQPSYEHQDANYGFYEKGEKAQQKSELKAAKIAVQTIAATKTLKIGSAFVIAQLFLVVVALGLVSANGGRLSPASLPLAVIPTLILAFVPALPLFLSVLSLAVNGRDFEQVNKERRKWKRNANAELSSQVLDEVLKNLLNRISEHELW